MKISISFYLILIICGTSSCSLTKRLHSRGYHIEFNNRLAIDKPEKQPCKIKERNNSSNLETVKKEHVQTTQIYATTDAILFHAVKQPTGKNFEDEQLKKNVFHNQDVDKRFRKTLIKVPKWSDYDINEISQRVLKESQEDKAERSGGMITGGGMDWIVPILFAIGFGLVIGLVLGLLTSSIQVFLVTAASSALVFILIYLLLWGLFSLMGL